MTIDDWWYLGEYEEDNEEEKEIDEARFKSSEEKTKEEKIRTSRTLKIKYNKWNNVDYEDSIDRSAIVIDPEYQARCTDFGCTDFENEFQEHMENSKYNQLFTCGEKITIDYDVFDEMLYYFYGKMKQDYSLSFIFVMLCEYCNVNIVIAFKKSSNYIQTILLKELKDVSKLPDDLLNSEKGLW